MSTWLSSVIFTLTLILLSTPTFAAEAPEQNISVKALGMGNAYMAHARAEDAVFYNPAGLSQLEGFRWRVVGLSLGLNGYDVYDEYSDLVDSADVDLASTLSSIYGKPIFGRADFYTSISISSFIIGAYATGNLGFTLLNPAYPSLDSSYFADYGMYIGWGKEIIPNYVDFGFVGKRITRLGGDIQIGPSLIAGLDSSQLEDSLTREGTGYAFDFGINVKFPTYWHPTFSFAWKDVGNTAFNINADDPAPKSVKDQMNVGIGFDADMGLFSLRPAIDYRGLNNTSGDVEKRLHAGVELDFPIFSFRGGFSQGYYTAGLTASLWIFELDVATYGVELGEYAGQDEDRRYVLQLSTDFGFNPSGGGLFSMSRSRRGRYKRSKRKQRR